MDKPAAPHDLRIEHLTYTFGIDIAVPRFSWKLPWTHTDARQAAYQVQVYAGEASIWDSGEVTSDQSHLVEYAGPALLPKTGYRWHVRAKPEGGNWSDWSEAAIFETGFLGSRWTGEWIGPSWYGTQKTSAPSPYLRKEFALSQKPVRARLYLSSLGVFEGWLNGEQVGNDVLAPGWTDYTQRVYYHTFDVTDLLQEGANAIGAILGDGWFCGHVGLAAREQYGDRPYLMAQLEAVMPDGQVITVATGSDWQCSQGGYLQADILMGEVFDANREPAGWSKPGFDAAGWESPVVGANVSPKLIGHSRPPIREVITLQPKAEPKKHNLWMGPKWIVDFGQNMVGSVRVRHKAAKGTVMTLRFGEMLNPDGTLYIENLRGAKQTDVYVFRGDEEGEVYEPRLTFHGFQYLEISGIEEPPAEIEGVVLCSDLEQTGEFSCSHPLINQLQSNIVWGQRGNFLDVPTDCPQRDERLGWTGDAQAFVATAAFNMNVAPFFSKWLQDLADSQKADGRVPPVAPHPSIRVVPDDGGPGWADAMTICPWAIYEAYGDKRLLEELYEPVSNYVGFLEKTSPGHIRALASSPLFRGFGDWLSIGADTPLDLIGTAFYAHSLRLARDISTVVSPADTSSWETKRQAVVQAFRDRYVTPDGLIVGQTQTSYVLALAFGLLPEEIVPNALQELVDDIGRRGWLLTCGFLGTCLLPHALSENGRPDVAFRLLLQTKCPSWLYPVTQGATTIWERWDGWTKEKGFQDPGMNSFNHYAFGAVGSWLYQKLAGIATGTEPGYKRFTLKPHLGGGLTHAEATYEGPYGRIASRWKVDGERLEWAFEIPANSSADVWIPAGEDDRVELEGGADFATDGLWRKGSLGSGKYRVTVSGPGILGLSQRGAPES